MLRLILMFVFCASLADAGAWPREQGRIFVANSIELQEFSFEQPLLEAPHFNSFYLEYGLTQSLTIGLHTGHGSTADLDARAFGRIPLGRHETHKIAAEISFGKVDDTTYLGLGLHYGRGIKLFDRYGWLSAESRVDFGGPSGSFEYLQTKLDLTFGLTHPNGMKTMAQLFTSEINGEIYSTFAPMLVVPLWKKTKLEAGILYDLTHERDPGLKLGVWQEF